MTDERRPDVDEDPNRAAKAIVGWLIIAALVWCVAGCAAYVVGFRL